MSAPPADPGPTSRVPGEILCATGEIEINPGAPVTTLGVVNAGDRPIQVGSHFHFPQTNAALEFDRARAHGLRLNIPAGTAVRFEPGVEMSVELVPIGGERVVPGLSSEPPGGLDRQHGLD